MADWSELPSDLLDLIARKVTKISDHLQYSAVCSSWRSVAIENRYHVLCKSFPKLVIPGETENSETRRCLEPIPDDRKYFNFCESINEKSSQKQLSVPHEYYCCGSSLGWLVLIDNSFEMQLFNPLSGVKFKLPSSRPRHYFLPQMKSSMPSTTLEVVILLILIAKQIVQYALPPPEEMYLWDLYLIELNGELYLAVRIVVHDSDYADYRQSVLHSDNDDDGDSGSEWDDGDGDNDGKDNESGNSDRSSDHESHEDDDDSDDDNQNDETDNESDSSDSIRRYRTMRFHVYKLEEGEEDGIKKWTRVKNIGDNAFFVGYNNSFSLQASDYFGCCKPNSIYFTTSKKPLPWMKPIRHDIGIFNLENKSVDSIFPVDSKPVIPPPFWFIPNL
ncbi:hypothetical protein AQUCO_03400220v1 [Aquilegia coerulea]|uniref:KIB1-4 beta-propeller domain-containing protein n=1 Tax=Aquilegia coerulea TaxID=218851 RepID=A0A2G5CY20_AQUCA|nr:hypothetical protein AQUCO_03400220v1 [Aquilegia coerulea]